MRAAQSRKPSRRAAQPESHPLDLPEFLVVTPERARLRRQWWVDNPPQPIYELEAKRVVDPEIEAFINRQEAERKLRDGARFRKLSERKKLRDATPDLRFHRWDPAKNRFVYDQWLEYDHRKRLAALGIVEPGASAPIVKPRPAVVKPAPRSRGPVDEVATNLAALGKDMKAMKKLARANGVWEARYDELPNDGLRRMTIGNRIRAMFKRGETIRWK